MQDNNYQPHEISKIIKKYRAKYGMTQRVLADLSCVSKQTIYELEHDKRSPTLDVLLSILDALSLTIKIEEVN